MGISNYSGLSAYDSDFNADELIARYDAYIIALARKKVPRNVISPSELGDEIDELAQKIRIKLWQIAQRKHITSPKAYIGCIAHTEAVDMVRRYKSTLASSLYEDGEIYQGSPIVTSSEEAQDPAEKLEQEEAAIESTTRIVEEVLALPPRQLHAMLYSLREQIEDYLPLIEALKDNGLEIEEMGWSNEREEMQRLRASLSVARKKMRHLKDKRVDG